MTDEQETNHAFARSLSDAGLGGEWKTIVVADGILDAWLEPMIPGFRLRPFLCALTKKPGAGTNVMPTIETMLLALNGKEIEISIKVRDVATPNVEVRGCALAQSQPEGRT